MSEGLGFALIALIAFLAFLLFRSRQSNQVKQTQVERVGSDQEWANTMSMRLRFSYPVLGVDGAVKLAHLTPMEMAKLAGVLKAFFLAGPSENGQNYRKSLADMLERDIELEHLATVLPTVSLAVLSEILDMLIPLSKMKSALVVPYDELDYRRDVA